MGDVVLALGPAIQLGTRKLVVQEVQWQQEAIRCAKAIAQVKLGLWIT